MAGSGRDSTSRATVSKPSASKVLAVLALLAVVHAAAEAREPMPAAPLTQSQLVARYLDAYVLPAQVIADLQAAARDREAAAMLAAPDLALQERATSGPDGSAVTLSASLEFPLIDPTRSLEVALAMNGSSMTGVEALEERRSDLRSFLVLLVQLEHAEDTAAQLREVLATVRRVRPSWVVTADGAADDPEGGADAIRLDELEPATDARFAMADLATIERQTFALRREIADASGVRSAQTGPILRDLSVLRVPGDPLLDVDDDAAVRACVHASVSVRRARLLAERRRLTRDRERSSALPSLTLRVEGGMSSSGARDPASASAGLHIGMTIPTWEVMTGALNVSGSSSGFEQELNLGWPNRYRDPPPDPTVGAKDDVGADAGAVEDQVYRDLLDTLATLADLRFRLAAVRALELRMEPVWRARAQREDMAAIEAARQRMATAVKRIDLEASIRFYRLDVAYLCRPLASLAAPSRTMAQAAPEFRFRADP